MCDQMMIWCEIDDVVICVVYVCDEEVIRVLVVFRQKTAYEI
mgnify:CR=1 FL=1